MNEIIRDGSKAYVTLLDRSNRIVGKAIVSGIDATKVVRYSWSRDGAYAKTILGGRTFYMHHLIAGRPRNGMVVDHIDRNGLNNMRSNLRHVPKAINRYNSNVGSNNTSGTTGVYYDKADKRWEATIRKNGKKTYLAVGKNKAEVVAARNKAVKRLI